MLLAIVAGALAILAEVVDSSMFVVNGGGMTSLRTTEVKHSRALASERSARSCDHTHGGCGTRLALTCYTHPGPPQRVLLSRATPTHDLQS